MILKQAAAENLELAAGNFLVGGFEQGAQRDQPAEIFVDPVLQHDQFGRGDALELGLGDALFPPSDRVGRDQRQQQSDAGRDQRRQVKPWPRRRDSPPLDHVSLTIATPVSIKHLRLSFGPHHGHRSAFRRRRMIGHRFRLRTHKYWDQCCLVWMA